jgi:hypothetical protein
MYLQCHHCKNTYQTDIIEPCPLCKCKQVKVINKPNKHNNGTLKKRYQKSIINHKEI